MNPMFTAPLDQTEVLLAIEFEAGKLAWFHGFYNPEDELWHLAIGPGLIEDPWADPPDPIGWIPLPAFGRKPQLIEARRIQ